MSLQHRRRSDIFFDIDQSETGQEFHPLFSEAVCNKAGKDMQTADISTRDRPALVLRLFHPIPALESYSDLKGGALK
jgi:hypothetical protein